MFYARHPGRVHTSLGLINGSLRVEDAWRVFHGENFADAFRSAVERGDVDGDGLQDVIVGAPGYGDDEGRVYLFSARTCSSQTD